MDGKKIEQALAKAFVVISKKAEEMTDITALKYNRYQLVKERNALLRELGYYVYKTHLINQTNNDKVANFIEELKQLDQEITKLTLKIEHR
jgi:hypothetical protein